MRQEPVIVNLKGFLTDFFRDMYPREARIPHYVTTFSVAAGLPSRPERCGGEGREGAGSPLSLTRPVRPAPGIMQGVP